MAYHQPAYQSIMTSDLTEDNNQADYFPPYPQPAQRRSKPRNLKDRLSKIVSMYVPSTNSTPAHYIGPVRKSELEVQLVGESDASNDTDRFGLLSLGGSLTDTIHTDISSKGPHRINRILDGKQFIASVGTVLSDAQGVDPQVNKMSCIDADGQQLYIGLDSLPYIFVIPISHAANGSLCDHLMTVRLTLPGVGDVVPEEVKLKPLSCSSSPEFYVIGRVMSLSTKEQPQETCYVLACFRLDGQLIAKTKLFNYPRYSSFDVDNDGNLLIACAMLQANGSTGNVPAAQVCKLTAHFERRVFSITMAKGQTMYTPEWVSRTAAGGCCWASVSRHARQGDMQRDTTAGSVPGRRLLAFPGSDPQANGNKKRSPKEWLQVVSWEFEDFTPGRLAVYDASRLLVLDSRLGSLACVTWPSDQPTAKLQRITRPSSRSIDLLCSTYRNACTTPTVYLVSSGDVFSFIFDDAFQLC